MRFNLTPMIYISIFLSLMTHSLPVWSKNSKECEEFKTNLPAQYKRGYLEVPLDYSEPEGPKIKIFYYTKMKPGQVPVAFFNGGPSASNRQAGTFSDLEDRFNLGLIYSDQRGTGCSGEHPSITDPESARIAGLYSIENIVRDNEVVREFLLGKNTPWVLFGQSYGGVIIERYISMYPHNIISAHNYAGIAFHTIDENYAEMMRSQIKVQKKYFAMFPGTEEKVRKVNELLTDDKCFQVNQKDTLCGKAILALIRRDNLSSESSWGRFEVFLDQALNCHDENCLFKSDLSLNPKFWENWAKLNEFLVLSWWSDEVGPLTSMALFRQDFIYKDDIPDNVAACVRAEETIKSEGFDLKKDLPINECDLLKQVYKTYKRDELKTLFKESPVRHPFTVSDLRRNMKKNKALKYFIYMGDFDILFSNPSVEKRNLPKDQVTYVRFQKRGHFGFNDEALVWQNISGIHNKELIGEGANLLVDEEKTAPLKVGKLGDSKFLGDLSPAQALNELVYVGLAAEALSPIVAEKVKGKFALIDRGAVLFREKVRNVLNAGATGFVIANNVKFPGDAFNGSIGERFDIPGVMISTDDGEKIKKMLATKKVMLQFTYKP